MALKPAPPELEEINLFDGLLFTPVGTSIDLFYGYENHVEFFMLRSDSTGVDFPYFILQDAIFNQVREIERVKANLCFQELEKGQAAVRNTVCKINVEFKLVRELKTAVVQVKLKLGRRYDFTLQAYPRRYGMNSVVENDGE